MARSRRRWRWVMVLLVLVLLVVVAVLFGILSWVVHHLFVLGVIAAAVTLVLVGRAHHVTPTSLRNDLQNDIHAAQPPAPTSNLASLA